MPHEVADLHRPGVPPLIGDDAVAGPDDPCFDWRDLRVRVDQGPQADLITLEGDMEDSRTGRQRDCLRVDRRAPLTVRTTSSSRRTSIVR